MLLLEDLQMATTAIVVKDCIQSLFLLKNLRVRMQTNRADLFIHVSPPCIRRGHGNFELTNQDSAGGKKSSVLTSGKQVRKGFEIRQLFSLEMA